MAYDGKYCSSAVNLKHIDIDVEENVSTIIEVRPL